VTTSIGVDVENMGTLLLQPDGKIVAIGPANSFSDLVLLRYLGQ
jgi:hypothetical protein